MRMRRSNHTTNNEIIIIEYDEDRGLLLAHLRQFNYGFFFWSVIKHLQNAS